MSKLTIIVLAIAGVAATATEVPVPGGYVPVPDLNDQYFVANVWAAVANESNGSSKVARITSGMMQQVAGVNYSVEVILKNKSPCHVNFFVPLTIIVGPENVALHCRGYTPEQPIILPEN